MEDTSELWKPFPLDTRYEVSTFGRVRNIRTRRVRKTPIKQNGYPGLVFSYGSIKRIGYDVHFMVALTWLGPRPEGLDISHQDGNRLNNHVGNLVYESRKDNSRKSFNKYSAGYCLKLSPDDVRAIRADTALSNNEWARRLGVKRATIWKVRKSLTWKHL